MKKSIFAVAFLLLFILVPGFVQGQSDFPNKPLTFIMPQPPGGPGDLSARLMARLAQKYLGQPVVVVNKVGGSGTVGVAAVAASKPDGYTFGSLGPSPMLLVHHLIKLSYHPLNDIEPFIQYGINCFGVSARYDAPFKTFKEAMEYARKNPGKVSYGSSGVNSAVHVTMEMIAREENVELVHVPFKGGPEAVSGVMGGHVSLSAGETSATLYKAKKLRLLAMFTERRWDEFPDAPTLKEIGYNVFSPYFQGLGTPKGVPELVLDKLESAFTKAYNDPEFAPEMKKISIPFFRNRKDFKAYIVQGYEEMGKAIQRMKK